jgi:hypothetical protein
LSLKTKDNGFQLFGLKTIGPVCESFGIKTTGMVCQWFGLKTTGIVSPGLASKPVAQFGDLGLKITATVSWFGPQNQLGYGLPVAPQN